MEDTPPGEVAEVDFGRLGLILDPETGKRKALWAMFIVLGNIALDRLSNLAFQIVIEGASYWKKPLPHRKLLGERGGG